MSTTEKASPPAAADAVTPQLGDATADAAAAEADGPAPSGGAAPNASETSETLSPAVRRLVRQFDLDITGIHGTGPSGRIRVGDVMTLLVGRTDTGRRDAPVRTVSTDDDTEPTDDAVAEPVAASTEQPAAVEPATHSNYSQRATS
jgi:pyruvate/2-oxoglutarate dehydrogenase complex dihydrolipoamide acyltransferase (E2) component